MKRIIQKVLTVFAPLAIILLLFLFYSAWTIAKENALRSCVYSVAGDLVEHSRIDEYARNGENWYVLAEEEAQFLLSKSTFGDCSTFGSKPQDMRDKKYQIAVRKMSKHGFEVTVWSKGFDNISGTEDDIVYPKNEKIPN